ncbi:MAG TPA: DUF6569 family protein, partial [Planctomycetota bacterium]|nr:DUF6569 family protein [Planctomycetota bacterium]
AELAFRASPAIAPALVRGGLARSAARLARLGAGPRPEQREVWNGVAACHRCVRTHSGTARLEDAYAAREADLELFLAALQVPAAVVADGIALVLGGEVVSLDLLEAPGLLRRHLPRALRALALDALMLSSLRGRLEPAAGPAAAEAARMALLRLVDELFSLPAAELDVAPPAAGPGATVRFAGDAVHGSALVAGDRVPALSAFPPGRA